MTNVSLRQRTRWIKRGRGKDSGGDGIKRGGEGEEQWVQSGWINIVQIQQEGRKDEEQVKKFRYETEREFFYKNVLTRD